MCLVRGGCEGVGVWTGSLGLVPEGVATLPLATGTRSPDMCPPRGASWKALS